MVDVVTLRALTDTFASVLNSSFMLEVFPVLRKTDARSQVCNEMILSIGTHRAKEGPSSLLSLAASRILNTTPFPFQYHFLFSHSPALTMLCAPRREVNLDDPFHGNEIVL